MIDNINPPQKKIKNMYLPSQANRRTHIRPPPSMPNIQKIGINAITFSPVSAPHRPLSNYTLSAYIKNCTFLILLGDWRIGDRY